MTQSSTVNRPKKSYSIVITTILSIAVTIIVGWWTLKYGTNKYAEAEYERGVKVEEQIVRLIEQDIINQTHLDIKRLKRFLEVKCKEEKVANTYSIKELVETAELNLISSEYLDKIQKDDKILSIVLGN